MQNSGHLVLLSKKKLLHLSFLLYIEIDTYILFALTLVYTPSSITENISTIF
ncbi:hypothetical protein bcere0026_10040 [Bacillus mycoides]|uniref:Uncharacterized protein n=1 Tax=Bacillus mycoides TaxID=1405 RepID=C2XQP6_BACMY|nr:hypothetical protein bcere0026_10040 [Bacillus mycoides]